MNINHNTKVIAWTTGVLAVIAAFLVGRYSVIFSNSHNGLLRTSLVSEDSFAPFWTVWTTLDEKYINAASSTPQDKVWGAIKGLAASEGDPYTVFFPPQENKDFVSDVQGNFGGIGMEIDSKNGSLVVVSPLKGSPAEKAGILPGDILIRINETDTSNLTVSQAVKLIRGPKDTTVTLTFIRKDTPGTLKKVVTRDIINIPTLDTAIKGTGDNKVFVIHLSTFTAKAPELFQNALREFYLSGSHKLVLDLRGNPGGYLDAAWDIASWFLPSGSVVVTEDYGHNIAPRIFYSKGRNIFNKNLQMYVLVDGGSASASEILSGALQDHGVAKLVGSQTFGKGSVQELIPITEDTSLKVTVAHWLTPNGLNISKSGIKPDYQVDYTAKDAASGTDPVMAKALQLLQD